MHIILVMIKRCCETDYAEINLFVQHSFSVPNISKPVEFHAMPVSTVSTVTT